jgi:hypothetical protein
MPESKGDIMTQKYSLSNDVPVNLQLFATDDEPDDNDVDYSEDIDAEDFDDNDVDDSVEVEEDENDDELPESSDDDKEDKQKGKPDKRFEAMRKKAEEQARKKIEAEKSELEAEKARVRADKMQLTELAIERQAYASITPERVWQKADEEGISESAARKMLESDVRVWVESEKQKVRSHFQQREQQKAELRNEEFFHALEKDVDAICDANPALSVRLVYDQLVGQRYKELTKAKSKQSEKSAIANEQDRMKRRTISGAGNSRKGSGVLSSFGREAAIAMGHDPREVAKHTAKRRRDFRI